VKKQDNTRKQVGDVKKNRMGTHVLEGLGSAREGTYLPGATVEPSTETSSTTLIAPATPP
jgi:hypothetical protein